jgi:mRNA interferase MazF
MKDFDGWNEQKKATEARKPKVHFHEREIWWCKLGVNVGSEQDGMGATFERPVLVVRNFNGRVFWGVPLTRTYKPDSRYYVLLERSADGDSAALPSQLRVISSKRLLRKIGTLDEDRFDLVVQTLRTFLTS